MSIQTELARLTNAKAAIKAAIEGKGVTVPDGTLLDGMASLIEGIEAGGTSNILIGEVTPTEDVRGITVEHNLGAIPSYIFYCCLDHTATTKNAYFCGGGRPNISFFRFARTTSDQVALAAKSNALVAKSSSSNPCAVCDLTETTMTLGNTGQSLYNMMGGVTYYWFMW